MTHSSNRPSINADDLVESASDAAFVIDGDRRVVAWNRQAEWLLGYNAAEVIGLTCGEVLQATLPGCESLCHPECDPFRCLDAHHPYGIGECKVLRKDGDWVSAGISSIAIADRTRRLYDENLVAIIMIRNSSLAVQAPQDPTLQVHTLGGFRISAGGRSIDTRRWKRKQAVTLLKYLITQLDRQVHFERLVDCLWPDVDERLGRERLKVTMYALRRELRAHGLSGDIIKTADTAYLLRRDAVWVDAMAFEKFVQEGRARQEQGHWQEALDRYAKAAALYGGDFMQEEMYTDWCAEERERLHELHLEMLIRQAECYAEQGRYAEAVQVCRQAVALEPCRENLHYALMIYLARNDSPDLALHQFRRCRQILTTELGIGPMPRTRELYEQIRDAEDLPAAGVRP